MEKVTTENPRRFSRREFLKAAGITAAAVGFSQLASSKSQGLEKESVAPKESGPEYNLLSPEAFALYAAMGGPETSGEEILDYFPQSYKEASDGLKGLWSRAIDAKLRDRPQENTSLTFELATFELATLPNKISFDYLLVPEGTKFFDIQEQEERILPCGSNVVVIGKIDGEENFLAIYQEPVNSCYYFAKVGEDVLGEQKDLSASENLIVEAFDPALQNLKEIGTPKERKRLYEVKEGESLNAIASRFGLPSWHCLYGKNPLVDPFHLRAGEKLMIPDYYHEADYIKSLTPNDHDSNLSLELCKEPMLYFPQTSHYVKEPFLETFELLGQGVLGYPISEATLIGKQFGNSIQYFENLIVEWGVVDNYNYIPGRPQADSINPKFYVYPLGWMTLFRSHPPEERVAPPTIGKFVLDQDFADFYEKNGGLEILGYPVADSGVGTEGNKIQFLTNCALNYNAEKKTVRLAPLGRIYVQNLSPQVKNRSWWFESQPMPEAERIMGIREALAMASREKTCLQAIEARAVLLRVANENRDSSLLGKREILRDNLIFDSLAPNKDKTFSNLRVVLAWHEARFEMNPVVKKAFDRLNDGGRLVNRLIQEKVPAEVFQDNKYPSLPEDWRGKFVFAGGTGFGGLGYENCPLIYGPYDQYRGEGPNDEQIVLEALVQNGLHEAIHSFIQPASKIGHSPGHSEEKPADLNFVPTDARKGLLAHMSMCLLTSAAQKYYGFEEKRDPRIDYILKVLEQAGVDGPEAEVIQAAVTFNSDRLWDVYEKARKENNPSMDSLMSTQKPDLTII